MYIGRRNTTIMLVQLHRPVRGQLAVSGRLLWRVALMRQNGSITRCVNCCSLFLPLLQLGRQAVRASTKQQDVAPMTSTSRQDVAPVASTSRQGTAPAASKSGQGAGMVAPMANSGWPCDKYRGYIERSPLSPFMHMFPRRYEQSVAWEYIDLHTLLSYISLAQQDF